MGNTPTTLNNENNDKFLNDLDTLVANFISQEEFQYYKNLSNIEECNKIFVVSKKLFKKYLSDKKTATLHKRVNVGSIEFKQDLDIVTDKVKINRFIEDIATFYTTIANIITTISLSMGLNIKDMYLKTLKRKTLTDEEKKYQDHLTNSRLREDSNIRELNELFNVPKNTPSPMISETPLSQSPNIVDHSVLNPITTQRGGSKIDYELSPSTHAIKILSDKMEEVNFCKKSEDIMNYEAIGELLKLFNNTEMDPNTLEFTNIDQENDTLKQHAIAKLKDAYDKTSKNDLLDKVCKSNTKLTSKNMNQIKSNDELLKLFKDYGEKLGEIALLEKTAQEKLIEIVKVIIVFPNYGNSDYKINPELTHNSLDKLVEKTRNILINYFIEIEIIYAICVDIYLLLFEKLKLSERETLSTVQEQLFTIQGGGGSCTHTKRKKNKTKKKRKSTY